MIGAMAAFAAEDALIKAASGTLRTGQILISFGLGGALLFVHYEERPGQARRPESNSDKRSEELWRKLGDGGLRKAAYRGG